MAKRRTRAVVTVPPASPCPCGLDATYADCCGALHAGRKTAATAEQLMRSRYSAFVAHDVAYLLHTWSTTTRPATLRLDNTQWTGLEILHTTNGTAFHTEGTVEFQAHYTHNGRSHSQHENGHFTRESGLWVYVAPVAQ